MGKCRVCGCTDNDCRKCIEETGERCYWVEEDLCSVCANKENARAVHKIFDDEVRFVLDKFDKVVTTSNPFGVGGEAMLSKDQLLKVYEIAAGLTQCRIIS